MDFTEEQRSNIERRLSKHIINNITTGCWEYKYSITQYGYAAFAIKTKKFLAHRISYQLYRGEIPNGIFVLHACDVRHCVNPDHLFLGTAKDNTQDMINKKRHSHGDRHFSRLHPEKMARGDRHGSRLHPEKRPRGEKQWMAKLTSEDIRYIRMWRGEGFSCASIARSFNVTTSLISRIVKCQIWKHII